MRGHDTKRPYKINLKLHLGERTLIVVQAVSEVKT